MYKWIDKYKKFPIQVKASIWFLICSFLQKGISNITTPIFTRLMSTAEYGNYNVFNSWMSIVSIIVALQLYSGVYEQALVKFKEDKDVLSSSLQGLMLTLTIIWNIIYLLWHSFWNDLFSLTTVQMLAMLLMIWTSGVFRFWSADQRVDYKYKALVVVTLLVSFMKPIVGVILVIYAKDKVTARILGLLIVEIIGYVGLFFVQMKKGRKFYSKKYWKYAIRFNIPLIPHYMSQVVLASFDRVMIKNLVGDNEAGIYSLAYSISSIMILFNTALGQTLSPWIYQKIKEKKVEEIRNISYISIIIIGVLNLLLILFAPEIVAIFAPKAYYDAIWVIPPVAISVYFMFLYDLFSKFEFYFEKTGAIMGASIAAAILNIILNNIFIRAWGYYAAGYTTLVCYILYAIFHFVMMGKISNKYLKIKYVYSPWILLKISAGFLVITAFMTVVYRFTIIRYFLISVGCLICIWKKENIKNIIIEIAKKRKGV